MAWPAVIDSCVLFQACLRDTLLRAAAADLFRLHWTQQILDDTTRNLIATGRVSADQAKKLEGALKRAFPDAMIEVPAAQVAAMSNHQDDRHVAAAAVVAGASVIVTGNLKHFMADSLGPYDIEAQSPDTFLVHLYDLAPFRMVQMVSEQAQALRRPGKTREQIIEALSRQAPNFTARLRQQLTGSAPALK